MSLMSPALAGGFFTTSTPWEAPRSCILLYDSFTQSSVPALKTLCPLPVHPSLPDSPWQPTGAFTVSMILPFPECHAIGIIQYIGIPGWSLPLSHKH